VSRRIISETRQATGNAAVDGYFDRVLKYIPADINAAWVAVTGLIKSADPKSVPQDSVMWVSFVIGIVLTGLWTWRQTQKQFTQTIVSMIAFVVWVFALGGAWITNELTWYREVYGSLLLILYTLAAGMIVPRS
jgi:hypothetical protein